MTLENLGWDLYFQDNFKPFADKGYFPARVVKRNKNCYLIAFDGEIRIALPSGKFLSHAESHDIMPVVGDWVAVEQKTETYLIQGLLNRKSCFSRKPAISGGRKIRHGIVVGGTTIAQAIAANIDIVFIVSTLSEAFNKNRIDCYLTMALASGVTPVFIFNKANICPDLNHQLSTIEQYIKNYPIYIVSVKTSSFIKGYKKRFNLDDLNDEDLSHLNAFADLWRYIRISIALEESEDLQEPHWIVPLKHRLKELLDESKKSLENYVSVGFVVE